MAASNISLFEGGNAESPHFCFQIIDRRIELYHQCLNRILKGGKSVGEDNVQDGRSADCG